MGTEPTFIYRPRQINKHADEEITIRAYYGEFFDWLARFPDGTVMPIHDDEVE